MRAAIIGAGIGGLCTAIGLARAGADATVFERAEVLKPIGSGLSIFGNGLAALDALGAGDAVRAISGSGATAFRAGQRTPDVWNLVVTILPQAKTAPQRFEARAGDFGPIHAPRRSIVWNTGKETDDARLDCGGGNRRRLGC